MNPSWFKRPDWPMEWELERRTALIQAITELPNGELLSEQASEGQAILLYSTSQFGRDEELPRNRPASLKASETELRALASLCDKLALHIESMHRPAVGSFFGEGGDLFTFANQVREAKQIAEFAFGGIEIGDSGRGAGKKIEAAQVTELSAHVFEHVTGKRPTFTTDPQSGQISGVWPDFLSAVFDALWIKASVASQVRAVSEKIQTKTAI